MYIYNIVSTIIVHMNTYKVCIHLQADVMLVKNAQNLMHAVIKTMQAAEAACMKVPYNSRATLYMTLQALIICVFVSGSEGC